MSIRARLALVYGAATIVTAFVVGALIWLQVAGALRASLGDVLTGRAVSAATASETDGPAGLPQGDATDPAPIFLVLYRPGGALVDASPGYPPIFDTAPATARGAVTSGGSTYEFRSAISDVGIRFLAGSSTESVEASLAALSRSLLVIGIPTALGSLLGGWWLAGRALRPVGALTREAQSIRATDLDRRLPVPSGGDELHQLAVTLNAMLDRVAAGVGRERAFIAAASHDLRTPISALRAELDLARDPRTTRAELLTAVDAAHADTVRLGALAAGLLDLAAADPDGRALVRTSVQADELVDTVIRRVAPLAAERTVGLARSVPGRSVRVDRVRLEQALVNLVVNAVTYGPSDSTVEIVARLERDPAADRAWSRERLWIEVLDRGPGVPQSIRARIFEPFFRGSLEQRTGNGLGLATADAAVRAHHGQIGVDDRDGGGARFWLWVPA